ncbi:MAG TPA: hypothetical protein VFK94_00545, partial [Patescibacteria group bacterium]|nr:hypothetical protein [Patescibacteria group bacterium]
GSTVMADVNLPFNDVVRTASSPLDSFFNMLTPGVRIPVELKMGRKFYGGIPVDDKTDYAASSIPQTSFLMQMMKKNANDEANGVAGTLLDPRTIQFLSGIGLHENTERQMNNELRGQSYDAAQAIKKKKEVGK